MIVKNQKVKILWNPANRSYYENKGYLFTKFGETFEVNIDDLLKGSNKKVVILCDYCGKLFKRPYYRHLKIRETSSNQKDNCIKCRKFKAEENNKKRCIPWSIILDEFKKKDILYIPKKRNTKMDQQSFIMYVNYTKK